MWLAPDAVPPPAPNPPAAATAPAPTEPEPPTLTGAFAQSLPEGEWPVEDDAKPRDAAPPLFVTETGLAFEMRVESAATSTEFTLSSQFSEELRGTLTLPTWNAGLFVGYQGARFTLGVGVDYARVSRTSTVDTMTSDTLSSVVVAPGLRVVIARTSDKRTELLGQLDVGLGTVWTGDGDDLTADDTYDRLRVQVAPAVRHWFTPSFAAGASVGFRYDDVSIVNEVGVGMTGARSTTTSGLFGSLQLTAVF